MSEEYIKQTDIKEITNNERNRELIRSLLITKSELRQAIVNFDQAEGDLIDYYTYQIKAYHAKIDYLIKRIKSEGLAMDMIKEMELRNDWAV